MGLDGVGAFEENNLPEHRFLTRAFVTTMRLCSFEWPRMLRIDTLITASASAMIIDAINRYFVLLDLFHRGFVIVVVTFVYFNNIFSIYFFCIMERILSVILFVYMYVCMFAACS